MTGRFATIAPSDSTLAFPGRKRLGDVQNVSGASPLSVSIAEVNGWLTNSPSPILKINP